MSNEELLKTRIKVLADWPGVAGIVIPNTIVNVDDEFTEDMFWIGGEPFLIDKIRDYPYLFKELEWWENREINELPDYVKYQNQIYKVKDKFNASVRCEKHPYDNKGLDADWGSCLPATEKDYLSNLAQLGCLP